MRVERLRVVHEPHGVRPVLRRENPAAVGPLFISTVGSLALVCGGCTFLLIRGVRCSDTLGHALLECPNCGALNESWRLHAPEL